LAVLNYAAGQYETAIDHCTLVMRSQDHSQCSSHVVQGELLPKIDDNIDNVLCLAVFYQHLRTAALNQQHQAQYVSVLTTELFAYYLHIKCLPHTVHRQFTQTSSTAEFTRYGIHVIDTKQLFICDVLLFVSLSRLFPQKFYHKPIWQQPCEFKTNPTEYNASDLVELLQKSAVEHMTTYRQIVAQDFGSVVPIVTTDFEALYAYKRGDYRRCLQLSTQNVRTQLYAGGKLMPDVSTFPGFNHLLDDDIVSLTALTLLVNENCRQPHSNYVYIAQVTLSLYLMAQCQLKLHHSWRSLDHTLDHIEVVHKKYPLPFYLDRLTLSLILSKFKIYVRNCADRKSEVRTPPGRRRISKARYYTCASASL